MSKRTASWIAWSICTLSLALTALSIVLLTLNLSHPGGYFFDYWIEHIVFAATWPTVGAVIISHHPNNLIGWLFCAIGFGAGLNHFVCEYAIYSLIAQPDTLPGAALFVWLAHWLYVPLVNLIIFLLLLFPTGRLPSSRWRWFVGLSAIVTFVGAVTAAFSSRLHALGPVRNPLGTESIGDAGPIVQPIMYTLALLAAMSIIGRLRYASEIERQQIRWFAYATAVAFIGGLVYHSLYRVIDLWWVWWTGFIIGTFGVLGMAVAMGTAILRYRLYELDLIINRTLVYGSLTLMLVLFYFGSVTALQYLFSLLTGQGNTLAIVASTLAIAALFYPLRRRIQSFIDRRFYRRKYDARKTLEAFGTKLRDETDLEKLCEDLAEVVDETMQPSHISLWLRFPSFSPNSSESSSEVRSSMQREPPPQ